MTARRRLATHQGRQLRSTSGGRTRLGAPTGIVEARAPRIMARMRPRHYDSLLVAGACVRAGTALDWHAKRITRLAERKAIGMMLCKILLDAVDCGGPFSMTLALDSNSVYAARPLFDDIVCLLFSPKPVKARGMAELRTLIFDWDGPLYLHGHGDLHSRLALAFAAL